MTILPDEFESPFRWDDFVAFSNLDGGFAYHPQRVVVPATLDAELLGPELNAGRSARSLNPIDASRTLFGDIVDPLVTVSRLRGDGHEAQLDHVFFAHSCCCCTPHPADRWSDSPWASPLRANPLRANPLRANPLRANAVDTNGVARSTVLPAVKPTLPLTPPGAETGPLVVVLDTGIPDQSSGHRPAVMNSSFEGDPDLPDFDGDGWLDAAGGHGTFIAGLIEQRVPGCQVVVRRVVQPQGYVTESALVAAIDRFVVDPEECRPAFLNLSLGGPVWQGAPALAAAIARAQAHGTVVVASAGNDATCEPTYPAALPGVVSVGAIGPNGPASFTNYGPWVRACAPGVDLVSWFFVDWNGMGAPAAGIDPDRFDGWGRWSGTSFAAPIVVAALVREMRRTNCTPREAVAAVIDAPSLARIPDLGTVVNL